ncbi:MAG: DUF4097 family beta strand repeat protein [Candidatus Aminicenantes bacterium]|nr:DUF4097 family beta strand repeat protein [Candidatus Aminicenantes bacterium]
MKRSEILIVLGLIAFGLIFQLLDSGKNPAGINAGEPLRNLLRGPVERIEKPVITHTPAKRILIVNPAGDMTFRNNETGALEILPTVECYNTSAGEARKMADQVTIAGKIRADGTIAIQTDIPGRYGFKQLRVRLDIRLPRDVPLDVYSRHGIIQMDHLQNPSRINVSRGDLEAVHHASTLYVQHTHGRVQLSDMQDALDIHTSFSKLTVRHCRNVGVKGHHSRILLEQVRGDVVVLNRHERVEMNDVQGNVNLQVSDAPVSLSRIDAVTLAIKSDYKSLRGRSLSVSSLDAMVSHGDLDFEFARLTDTLSIKARHSDLRLSIPGDTDPQLHVQLKYGRFTNRSPLKARITRSRTMQQVNSDGETPVIVVDGRYCDVILSQSSPLSID